MLKRWDDGARKFAASVDGQRADWLEGLSAAGATAADAIAGIERKLMGMSPGQRKAWENALPRQQRQWWQDERERWLVDLESVRDGKAIEGVYYSLTELASEARRSWLESLPEGGAAAVEKAVTGWVTEVQRRAERRAARAGRERLALLLDAPMSGVTALTQALDDAQVRNWLAARLNAVGEADAAALMRAAPAERIRRAVQTPVQRQRTATRDGELSLLSTDQAALSAIVASTLTRNRGDRPVRHLTRP